MSVYSDIEVGKSYPVDCPFVRDVFVEWDEDGESKTLSWKPGIVWEQCGPEDVHPVAHGFGKVIYTIVDVHKLPHPYPARVFFTRKWQDPDGRVFGRTKLHIMTTGTFKSRLRGYLFAGHDGREPVLVAPDSEAIIKAA